MGNFCQNSSDSRDNEVIIRVETYKDVSLKRYTSEHDDYYDTFERKNNLLRCIQLHEFSILFGRYNFDHSAVNSVEVSTKIRIFTDNLEKGDFLSFFQCKVINNHACYEAKEENNSKQIYLDFLTKVFDTVGKGYISFIRHNNKAGRPSIVDKKQKKYFLVAYGFLFCHSDNNGKINYLFEIFCNNLHKLEPTQDFHTFLYVLFLIASYAGISSFLEISKMYPNHVPKISQSVFLKILDIYEVNDILTIKDQFIDSFFSIGGSLTYYEYKDKIVNEGFDWILSGAGIRRKLEEKHALIS